MRTDYWKSNEKKYCDFCKCWITDNKITIITHEGGKKHKENVARRISEINKKSTKEHKMQMKIDDEMSKMERNAMAAYLKDVQSNADLTSQLINEKLAETNSTLSIKEMITIPTSSNASKKSKTTKSDHHKSKDNKKKSKEESPRKSVPLRTPAMMGPQPRADDPYGSWTSVEPEPTLDLDLPEQKYVAPVVAPIIAEPEKKFKEKQIIKLEEADSTVSAEFKKRKINSSAKRNTRQRLDDD